MAQLQGHGAEGEPMTEAMATGEAGMTSLAEALDRLAAMPGDDAARLGFHAALTASEVILWLAQEPGAGGAGQLDPQVFDLESGPTVLAFDSEAALVAFASEAAPYAALPGRVLVGMLAGSGDEAGPGAPGLSLLVQSESGAAELLDPAALRWLAGTLSAPGPEEGQSQPRGFAPPDVPEPARAALAAALERRLSGVPGLEAAVLARVSWQDGSSGHALALIGLPEVARRPLSRAVAEALGFSGAGLDRLDVIFPNPAQAQAILAVGARLNPTPWTPEAPTAAPAAAPGAPGSDPARPPRLR